MGMNIISGQFCRNAAVSCTKLCLAPGSVILCTHDAGVPYIIYILVHMRDTHYALYEKHNPI